ncbi:MAG: energy transducer TonB, partial [Pseudomonadota bacterium]|nr:energy transducer TonB [Pseudomonadota bacterium]
RSKLTYREKPIYPLRAREKGISGSCVSSFQIDSGGETEDVIVNCTDDVFKSNTIRALKKYVFEPDDYESPKLIVYFRLKD